MPPFPQASTNLGATANGDTAVNLSWTASSTGNLLVLLDLLLLCRRAVVDPGHVPARRLLLVDAEHAHAGPQL